MGGHGFKRQDVKCGSVISAASRIRDKPTFTLFYSEGSRAISVHIETGVGGWTSKGSSFDSRKGLEIYLFCKASRRSLGLTQPPVQWIPEVLSWV